jgi:hypothetical protein
VPEQVIVEQGLEVFETDPGRGTVDPVILETEQETVDCRPNAEHDEQDQNRQDEEISRERRTKVAPERPG